ncbi:hypothetical protein [Paenibacillus maysiensis]|uniref:hypothetical protein n=1 Tax=Paenibacillus maysiensis TaxID=1155954 RepID=UPI00047107EB|nr:hypothetical protein [Paenibacillus maysiensis]
MDFENLQDGLGQMSFNDMEQLTKALGSGVDGPAYGDGSFADMSALRPQSLESTLKVVTAKEENLVFWRSINKSKANGLVEEFNVMDSYGQDVDPYMVEGGVPTETDSNYTRQTGFVKFFGTLRRVTLQAMLTQTVGVGDIKTRETMNGTMAVLQQVERAMYLGDSSKNPLAMDGLLALVKKYVIGKPYASQHIFDLKGGLITENVLEDAATVIADNWGNRKLDLHISNQVHKDFSKTFTGPTGRQRIVNPGEEIMMGQPVRGYAANSANITFLNNVFLKPEGAPKQKSQKDAPAIPVLDSAKGVADINSTVPAGTYYYFISAKGRKGESAPVPTTAIAITDKQRVEITIQRVDSGDVDLKANSYKVYRGYSSNPAQALFMTEVADSGSGTTQVIVDDGADIPGTEHAFLIDNDGDNVLRFKQFAPLMNLALGRVDTSDRFMILLFGMLQVYNPRRIVVFKNVGKLGENSNRELFGPSYDQPSFGTIKPVFR